VIYGEPDLNRSLDRVANGKPPKSKHHQATGLTASLAYAL
jgi:hypothetical protein